MRYSEELGILTFDIAVSPEHAVLHIQDPNALPFIRRLANLGVAPIEQVSWRQVSGIATLSGDENKVVSLRLSKLRDESDSAIRMPRQLPLGSASDEADRLVRRLFRVRGHVNPPPYSAAFVELSSIPL